MKNPPSALLPVRLWIFFCTSLVIDGWLLSLLHQLNATGYLVSGLLIVLAAAWIWRLPLFRACSAAVWKRRCGKYFRRMRQPFCALFGLLLLCQMIGGLLYAPTNYDGLAYRLPRLLHWLAENRWHWIGGWNTRMDYSGVGHEWLSAPLLALTKSDRWLFLPDLISLALLPGLVFSAYRLLGVAGRVARYWMWILPTGYSFILQAGSIGNDSFAAVYVLAGPVFALRAARSGKRGELWLAMLAMGLFTGAKASNLPLLLPCAISLWPALRVLPWSLRSLTGTLLIGLLAAAVSFLPLAIINWHQTGDWAGDPQNISKMKLNSPGYGLAGNALQLAAQNLQPPLLPGVERINARVEAFRQTGWFQRIVLHFPRISLKFNDLAAEEGAGVGPGILLLGGVFCLLANFPLPRWPGIWKESPIKRWGLLVGISAWCALIVMMAGLGSEAVPRLATPYYPLLLLLPSLFPSVLGLLRNRAWQIFSFLAAASILPAVILSPARPLFPLRAVLSAVSHRAGAGGKMARVLTVYTVYQQRSDALAAVREEVPPTARVLGFAGTADESEISFWRPFSSPRHVRDLPPVLPDRLPNVAGLDALVTSPWGSSDRYGRTPEELAAALGWHVAATIPVQIRASGEPVRWALLLP